MDCVLANQSFHDEPGLGQDCLYLARPIAMIWMDLGFLVEPVRLVAVVGQPVCRAWECLAWSARPGLGHCCP